MAYWKAKLTRIQKDYSDRRYLDSDPVEFIHRFNDPLDQEAVAVFISMFAYGNAQLIRRAANQFFETSGLNNHVAPRTFFLKTDFNSVRTKKKFSAFSYRFHSSEDLIELMRLVQFSIKKYGSLKSHFLSGFDPKDADITNALNCFTTQLKSNTKRPSPAVRHSLSSPQDKSACKRWCMLLRWLVRKDQIDPGSWSNQTVLKPCHLIIPVDTHVFRISRDLSMTRKKTPSWSVALEITDKLKQICPDDPVQFDFALSRIGILNTRSKMKAIPL